MDQARHMRWMISAQKGRLLLDRATMSTLRTLCGRMGLSVTGRKKNELCLRIYENLNLDIELTDIKRKLASKEYDKLTEDMVHNEYNKRCRLALGKDIVSLSELGNTESINIRLKELQDINNTIYKCEKKVERYRKLKSIFCKPSSNSCNICMEEYDESTHHRYVFTRCGHCICKTCNLRLLGNRNCPTCRISSNTIPVYS
jgi:hypothetical protein